MIYNIKNDVVDELDSGKNWKCMVKNIIKKRAISFIKNYGNKFEKKKKNIPRSS